MTFEKVLSTFTDYLNEDKDYEVIQTSHGYAVMGWDDKRKNWNKAEHCATPEELRDHLLSAYRDFLEVRITDCDRPLTEDEERQITAAQQAMKKKCDEVHLQ